MKQYNKKSIIYTSIIAIFSILVSLVAYYATAQTEPIDKIFIKDFCVTENTLLDDILYTTGEQLSYDSSGCPQSVKVIHRWNELSIVSQNTITARLTSNGYVIQDSVSASGR